MSSALRRCGRPSRAAWARSDEELRKSFDGLDEEEDLALPKLLLLHTMLTRRLTPSLGVKRLREQRTMGSCEGVLLCDPLWKQC